jgi:polyphosphate kinase
MQEWMRESGAKDLRSVRGSGHRRQGGTIKRITERVSPRVFRVVDLPTPTEREKSQMCMQRYVQHFPAAGEVVIFDRRWYNRAGVEPGAGLLRAGADQAVPAEDLEAVGDGPEVIQPLV